MRHCLSCDCPETQPDSFVEGLCEKCFERFERLRNYPGHSTAAHRRTATKMQPDLSQSALASPPATPIQTRTAGASSSSIGLILMIGGFAIAGALLSFDSRLAAAVFWGGILVTLGLYALLSTSIREATQPLREQNAESMRLLRQIASQTTPPANPPIPLPADDAPTNSTPNESPE